MEITQKEWPIRLFYAREALRDILDTLDAIYGCDGWREALDTPGSVADWMGPRLAYIKDNAEEGLKDLENYISESRSAI